MEAPPEAFLSPGNGGSIFHLAPGAQPFPMSPSRSAPDISSCVSNLVDRFNTLEVKDRDEEKTAKQIKRLEAALRRAEIAREEAETEAKRLRAEVRDVNEVGEEWVVEKQNLKGRCEEFEKKYEKAKAHFRAQRSKHEEATRKAAKEFMEREKQHWRVQAAAEEEIEWERKLRVEAYELAAFMEIERQVMIKTAAKVKQQRSRKSSPVRADSAVDGRMVEDEKLARMGPVSTTVACLPTNEVVEEMTVGAADAADEEMRDTEDLQMEQVATREEEALAVEGETAESPTITVIDQAQPTEPEQEAQYQASATLPSVFQDATEVDITNEQTPEPELCLSLSLQKPKTLTVPINFGDEEEEDGHSSAQGHCSDKENAIPLQTPIRRPASALAASCHRTPPATISTSTLPSTSRTPNLHNRAHSVHAPTDPKVHPRQLLSASVSAASSDWRAEDQARTDEWNIPGVLASADLDRAAALAAIRSRRSRARSFMDKNAAPTTPARKQSQSRERSVGAGAGNGPKTPATEGPSRRDVSAPVGMAGLGSLSVGRVRAGRT